MNLLLDTHIFLWYITADSRLPSEYRDAIKDATGIVYLSVASIWETVVKHSIGKLPLPAAPSEYLPRQRVAHRIASLPIDEQVMSRLECLPMIHRDPFDRILAAQALHYNLTVVSVDDQILAYPVKSLRRLPRI